MIKPGLQVLFCAIATLVLASCASDFQDMVKQDRLLEPWIEIKGAPASWALFGQPPQINSARANYITLSRPATMSAQGNDLYLFDAGLRGIFRYDRGQQTLTQFSANMSPDAGGSIYAAPDSTVFIADREKVLHFTRDGVELPPLISQGNLARPVSITVDVRTRQILVADGMFDHIIVFNNLGATLNIIKPQNVLTISAMVAGPDGLYIVDRLAKQVVVVGWDGSYRYSFGKDVVNEPGNIAVSRDNLIFVSDNFNHLIKVYRVKKAGGRTNGIKDESVQLVEKIGGFGLALGNFNGIAGISLADNFLFVSDSLNARVQIMFIDPRAHDKRKKE